MRPQVGGSNEVSNSSIDHATPPEARFPVAGQSIFDLGEARHSHKSSQLSGASERPQDKQFLKKTQPFSSGWVFVHVRADLIITC
jgi:hypothetical protein